MIQTRKQQFARAAFQAVQARLQSSGDEGSYLSFSRSFPTLVHTSGLAQAVAFALGKGDEKLEVLEDVAAVLHATNRLAISSASELDELARSTGDVREYARLTRDTLEVATWIKRYAEALVKSPAGASV